MKPYVFFGVEYHDPRYDAWWQHGNRYGFYALVHRTRSDFREVEGLAVENPRIQWVVTHCGSDFKTADQAVETTKKHPNVYAEITYTSVPLGMVEYQRRFSRGLFFQAAWRYANLLDDVPDERNDLGPVIENPFDRRRERGREPYAVRHRVTGAFIYELSVGPGRRFWADLPGAFNHMLGGWTVSSLLYFETGRYFTPSFSGVDVSGTGATSGRPDRISNGNVPADQRTVTRWFDTAAFVVPPRNGGRFGNTGRNILEATKKFSSIAECAGRIGFQGHAPVNCQKRNSKNQPFTSAPAPTCVIRRH